MLSSNLNPSQPIMMTKVSVSETSSAMTATIQPTQRVALYSADLELISQPIQVPRRNRLCPPWKATPTSWRSLVLTRNEMLRASRQQNRIRRNVVAVKASPHKRSRQRLPQGPTILSSADLMSKHPKAKPLLLRLQTRSHFTAQSRITWMHLLSWSLLKILIAAYISHLKTTKILIGVLLISTAWRRNGLSYSTHAHRLT